MCAITIGNKVLLVRKRWMKGHGNPIFEHENWCSEVVIKKSSSLPCKSVR